MNQNGVQKHTNIKMEDYIKKKTAKNRIKLYMLKHKNPEFFACCLLNYVMPNSFQNT